MVFLQNSLRNLAGSFGAEFDPEQGIRIAEQGIRIAEQGIWRPPDIPNPRRDFVHARLAGTALAGGSGCVGATRISAATSITNPSASLAPPFGFLARDAEFSLQSPQSP
jgi:hypothetical protein